MCRSPQWVTVQPAVSYISLIAAQTRQTANMALVKVDTRRIGTPDSGNDRDPVISLAPGLACPPVPRVRDVPTDCNVFFIVMLRHGCCASLSIYCMLHRSNIYFCI